MQETCLVRCQRLEDWSLRHLEIQGQVAVNARANWEPECHRTVSAICNTWSTAYPYSTASAVSPCPLGFIIQHIPFEALVYPHQQSLVCTARHVMEHQHLHWEYAQLYFPPLLFIHCSKRQGMNLQVLDERHSPWCSCLNEIFLFNQHNLQLEHPLLCWQAVSSAGEVDENWFTLSWQTPTLTEILQIHPILPQCEPERNGSQTALSALRSQCWGWTT